jgi:hypothetical protein
MQLLPHEALGEGEKGSDVNRMHHQSSKAFMDTRTIAFEVAL